jgi:hypothetical protein
VTERLAECVTELDALVATAAERMREVLLPLHILLENRFGDLNENQEEMLEAARRSADAADAALRHARRVVERARGREG